MYAWARDMQIILEHIDILVRLNKMVDSIRRRQQRDYQTFECVLYSLKLARAC